MHRLEFCTILLQNVSTITGGSSYREMIRVLVAVKFNFSSGDLEHLLIVVSYFLGYEEATYLSCGLTSVIFHPGCSSFEWPAMCHFQNPAAGQEGQCFQYLSRGLSDSQQTQPLYKNIKGKLALIFYVVLSHL